MVDCPALHSHPTRPIAPTGRVPDLSPFFDQHGPQPRSSFTVRSAVRELINSLVAGLLVRR